MLGRFISLQNAFIASGIALGIYIIALCIIGLITRKLGKANNHSFAIKTYNHIYYIITTYLTMILIVVLSVVWAGIAIGIFEFVFFLVIILIKYAYVRTTKDFYAIYDIVKNNKCDVNDYIRADGESGKITGFNLYHLELMNADGSIAYIEASDINKIINYSKNIVNIQLQINVSINNDSTKLIKLLEQELPLIVKDYPFILEGPNIDGIGNINSTSYDILLSTKVEYENISKAKDAIQTKALELIGKENAK